MSRLISLIVTLVSQRVQKEGGQLCANMRKTKVPVLTWLLNSNYFNVTSLQAATTPGSSRHRTHQFEITFKRMANLPSHTMQWKSFSMTFRFHSSDT